MNETKKLPTTGRYSGKPYKCVHCGKESKIGTNHWGECYPHCSTCNAVTVHVCQEPVPEGMGTLEPWKIVKLKDICDIS